VRFAGAHPSGRRSRTRRTPVGKRLALTARDLEIFRALAGYRYLRSTYVYAFAGGASETRFKERLGDLFHEGFIDRPQQQWQFAEALHSPVVYELGDRARRLLAEYDGPRNYAHTFLSQLAHRQFKHAVSICDCLASIELATSERSALRFIPWSEILARAPEKTKACPMPFRIPVAPGIAIVPDGLFGLEYQSGDKNGYRFFALEVDRGTMPVTRTDGRQTSYFGKLEAYRELVARELHKSHFGIPNLFVLTVTTTERRVDDIVHAWGDRGGLTARFLFKADGAASGTSFAPSPRLVGEPWRRATCAPLLIGNA
jgi:Replication-relaxation